jgi:2-oxoglutarate ferredoxin oxidoreductase subunit beta
MHALRRNLDMVYIIENNGVYGLTKGQFSASADIGSKAKRGEVNQQPPIDPVQMALALGGSFVARGFSGDKEQLVPLIKAGVRHRGLALIDVISPCVTFNDHEDSTKSYAHAREFNHRAIHADFVPPAAEIRAAYDEGEAMPVDLHDGSRVLLRKVAKDYDASNRGAAIEYIRARQRSGEIVTGLLYIDGSHPDMHGVNATTQVPLSRLPYEDLCPGPDALASLQKRFR